jgi:hypothetical protein
MRLLKLLLACRMTKMVYGIAKRWENVPNLKKMRAAREIQEELARRGAKKGYRFCARCGWAIPPGQTHNGRQGCA